MVGLAAGARDNRKIEARPDVLTFTGTELAADHAMAGPVTATIHLRSSLVHTDVFVRICDVHPGGRSLNVSDGILRLDDQNAPADEDGIRVAQLELWPLGHVFRRGHRIRVQVSSGAHPRYLRNLGTGEPIAVATTMQAADQEIFHDPAHPSAVVLPTAAAPTT
jgi:putative CocE/NonD family hydrolase